MAVHLGPEQIPRQRRARSAGRTAATEAGFRSPARLTQSQRVRGVLTPRTSGVGTECARVDAVALEPADHLCPVLIERSGHGTHIPAVLAQRLDQ